MTKSDNLPATKGKFRSRAWFDNPANADMTALYLERYMNFGLSQAELQSDRPIIGIAQTGSDLSPCNRHHLELANRLREGIREAGGIAIEFPVHPIQETGKRPTAGLDRNLAYLGLVVVNYQGILDHYWVNVDPFDAKGQFCDKGHSYLSAIFVANDSERAIAESTRQAVVKEFPNQTVVTPILTQSTFYPIKGNEAGHQNYYKTNPVRYKLYRYSCGRDKRLKQIWGNRVTQH